MRDQAKPRRDEHRWVVQHRFKLVAGDVSHFCDFVGVDRQLDVGADDTGKPSSHHSVILKERLAQSSLFQKLGGIIIVETQPQTLEVDTERLQSIVLPVRIEAGDVLLTSTSAVEPQSVTLTVTAAIAPQLDSAFVEARLNAETLRKLPVDTAQTLQVPLTLPDQWKKLGVAIPPTIAKVTVTVRKQTETFVIKTIPINLSGPPTALAKYSVVFDDEQRLLRDVTVTGPHDVIEKIRKDQKLVRADLWVTADELEKNAGKGPVKGTLSITAPANVTYDPPAMVTYTVEAVSR